MNIDNFGTRLNSILKHYGVSSIDFAEDIGVSQNTVSRYITGKTTPNLTVIDRILKHFKEVDSSWLVLGKGNMFNTRYILERDYEYSELVPDKIRYFLEIFDFRLFEIKTDNLDDAYNSIIIYKTLLSHFFKENEGLNLVKETNKNTGFGEIVVMYKDNSNNLGYFEIARAVLGNNF